MEKVGKVLALFISDKEAKTLCRKTEISLDHQGIQGDKHYGSAIERTVLISSIESYHLVEEQIEISMPYGYLGENLLLDFNPYSLPLGSQLQIGTCILEITQNCTLCNHLSALDKRIPKLLKNDRGIFAKVIQPGDIHQEDTVSLLYHATQENLS